MNPHLRPTPLFLLALTLVATAAEAYTPHDEALKDYAEDFFDAMSRGSALGGAASLIAGSTKMGVRTGTEYAANYPRGSPYSS